ncbi:glycosyltransferase family 4 protein [Persicitalea jodogahamensis]|uniref:glycosyltransferase family 4 protein n=1 Tax=Persicitalea jodogahamensis TaxID=402147 RepID=UPI00167B3D25|nr:glycosyltransferase family 4 protein [Persicitalea jodogahamensis]
MSLQKVLFISHDANRAGSQLLLLQLVGLLKDKGIPTHLLLCEDGDLVAEFEQVTSVTLVKPIPQHSFLQRLLGVVLKGRRSSVHENPDFSRVKAELMAQNFGLVFVNSVANAEFYHKNLEYLHHLPAVLFAHELQMSVATYSEPESLKFLLARCRHLIAVSKAVAHFYVKEYHFPPGKVSTFTLINTLDIRQRIASVDPKILQQELNLPDDAIVIGGCGNAEWRKGNDIFNLVAREVIERLPEKPIYFVWVGAGDSQPFYELIKFDIERFGLADRIRLIPPTPRALDIMTRFDLFLLSSREDPYPLVVLEAALLQKPIVCFDQAGGAPELVESDAGEVVKYLDVHAAADAVISLIENKDLRLRKGKKAHDKVLDRHDTALSVQKVIDVIEDSTGQDTLTGQKVKSTEISPAA